MNLEFKEYLQNTVQNAINRGFEKQLFQVKIENNELFINDDYLVDVSYTDFLDETSLDYDDYLYYLDDVAEKAWIYAIENRLLGVIATKHDLYGTSDSVQTVLKETDNFYIGWGSMNSENQTHVDELAKYYMQELVLNGFTQDNVNISNEIKVDFEFNNLNQVSQIQLGFKINNIPVQTNFELEMSATLDEKFDEALDNAFMQYNTHKNKPSLS